MASGGDRARWGGAKPARDLIPNRTKIRVALSHTPYELDDLAALPADLRPKLEATFRDLGRQATAGARRTETDAITAMKKVGLKVVPLTDQATWARMVEDGRDEMRSKVVPAAVYDEVRQHVKDFRAGKR